VLVNNAAFQMSHETVEEITDEEWQYTFDTNITAMFRLVKAALSHLGQGASIINTSSVNYDQPSPRCCPTPRPRARSPTSPPGWPRCSVTAASG
jgi:NAD(P)-dependent dehydrogenase (short-subunit alcohol dehydrogenase family)